MSVLMRLNPTVLLAMKGCSSLLVEPCTLPMMSIVLNFRMKFENTNLLRKLALDPVLWVKRVGHSPSLVHVKLVDVLHFEVVDRSRSLKLDSAKLQIFPS